MILFVNMFCNTAQTQPAVQGMQENVTMMLPGCSGGCHTSTAYRAQGFVQPLSSVDEQGCSESRQGSSIPWFMCSVHLTL